VITCVPLVGDRLDARNLPLVFSNYTRCASCRATYEIRVVYCPGCAFIAGSHFHRECRCGATWMERSAGHAGVDISLDNPAFVPICQPCQARHTHLSCMQPKCCQQPEVSYHDVRAPCELCASEAS